MGKSKGGVAARDFWLVGAWTILFWAVALGLMAQQTTDPRSVYVDFLIQQGLPGPPCLTGESFTAADDGSYQVAYTVSGVGSDVKEVRITLWRLIDDPYQRHYYQEDFRILTPLDAASAPVIFSALMHDENYAVHLSVMTSMPSIISGTAQPDVEIHVQTIAHLWPGGQNFQWSTQDLFLPYDRDKHLRFTVYDNDDTHERTFFAHHAEAGEMQVAGPTTDRVLTFCNSEEEQWAPATIDALILEVTAPSTAAQQFEMPLVNPCNNCNPLLEDPIALSAIQSGHLQVGLRNDWGGAIATIQSDWTGTRNLVESLDRGMLMQAALWDVNTTWASKGFGTLSREPWEDNVNYSGCDVCQPSCGGVCADNCPACPQPQCRDYAVLFDFNPTQAGSDSSVSHPCTMPGDNTLSTLVVDILPGPANPYLPYLREQPVAVSGGTATYISRYAAWEPYDNMYNEWAVENALGQWHYTTPDSKFQPNLWETGTVTIESGLPSQPMEVGTIHTASQYRLTKLLQVNPKAAQAQVWPPIGSDDKDFYLQDRYFGASRFFTQVLAYNPNDTSHYPDPWGMIQLTSGTKPPLCTLGPGASRTCYALYGWNLQASPNPWVPYAMTSNDSGSFYALLYSAQDGQETPYIRAGRTIILGPSADQFYIDRDAGPLLTVETLFDNGANNRVLSTDAWSSVLNTYLILGPTRQGVMSELGRVSVGKYPLSSLSLSGTIAGLPASMKATVDLSGPYGAVSVKSSGPNYVVYGLANGSLPGNFSYTVTVTPACTAPDCCGYTITPTSQDVTISGTSPGSVNFSGTPSAIYSISGNVTGAVSVTMTLGGAAAATTTTDTSGNYTFSGLSNGSYTVTPTESGYAFGPTSTTLTVSCGNQTGINFSATLVTYSISGTITSGGAGLSGVLVSARGLLPVTTNGSGTYTFAGLNPGSYTLIPSKPNYRLTPYSQTVSISNANISNINFTATSITPFRAYATGNPQYGTSPLLVSFTGSASGGSPPYASWHWDFGDNTSSTLQNPTHTYNSPGSYTAWLVVHDSAGNSSIGASVSITVSSGGSYQISGTTKTSSNSIIPNVTVSLYDSNWNLVGTLSSGTSGTFVFGGLASGNYHVTAYKPGWYTFTECDPYLPPNATCNLIGSTINIVGQDFHKSGSGQYQVQLNWQADPMPGVLYQIAYQQPSASTWQYTDWMIPTQDGIGGYSLYFSPPSGCTDYLVMVRLYDPIDGVTGDWSDTALVEATPTVPTAPTAPYARCGKGPAGLSLEIGWNVDPQIACSITMFVIESTPNLLSTAFTPFARVQGTGASSYQQFIGSCINGLTYFRVTAYIGDTAGLPSAIFANVGQRITYASLVQGFALFGCDSLSVNGNTKTYGVDVVGGQQGFGGNIGSNGNITVTGTNTINGNATPGPGQTVKITGNQSQVLGSRLPAPSALPCEQEDIPAWAAFAQANNNNSAIPSQFLDGNRNFTLNGNKACTLSPGGYYVNNFTVNGSAQLLVSGPVAIMCTGALTINGGDQVNQNGDPTNLLFILSTSANVTLNGTAKLSLIIHAPYSQVTLSGNVTGFGSLWGKSLSANGSVVWNRVKDPATPSLSITQPTDGSMIANNQPVIAISYSNNGAMTGLNLQSLAVALDGASIVNALTVTATGATGNTPAALSNGSHTLTTSISDYDGNTAQTTVTFTVEQ